MVETTTVVAAAALGVVAALFALFVLQKGENAEARRSRRAHADAKDREPPVDLGGTYEGGIHEFTTHHSGEEIAVVKVEGFVLFVEDVPRNAQVGDVIEATVLSWNENRTSADATFEGRA
jgi:predicted RNA-binding protein with TRAM domain